MRRSPLRIPLLLAPAAALLALGLVAARYRSDAADAAESLFLAVWAATPLALLTVLSDRAPRLRLWVPGAATIAAGIVVLLVQRDGGTRPALVGLLLVVATLLVARPLLRARTLRFPALAAALALDVAWIASGHHLFDAGERPATWLRLVLLPGLATALAVALARRGLDRTAPALAGALLLAPLVAGEPWWLLLAATALLCLAAFGTFRPARTLVALGAAAALLAGSFPWLRPAPVATLLAHLPAIAAAPSSDRLGGRSVVLSTAKPTLELALPPGPVSSVTIDSYLTNSLALPCGAVLARLQFAGTPAEAEELRVGRDSAEWAAARPDVTRATACAPPPAWVSWVPSSGRFFGRTTRTHLALATAPAGGRFTLERDSALPAEVSIALFRVSFER
ncbi:MAG: hypothetical protein AB7G12_13325 [Thermoanaerobaculia bacterium]